MYYNYYDIEHMNVLIFFLFLLNQDMSCKHLNYLYPLPGMNCCRHDYGVYGNRNIHDFNYRKAKYNMVENELDSLMALPFGRRSKVTQAQRRHRPRFSARQQRPREWRRQSKAPSARTAALPPSRVLKSTLTPPSRR